LKTSLRQTCFVGDLLRGEHTNFIPYLKQFGLKLYTAKAGGFLGTKTFNILSLTGIALICKVQHIKAGLFP